MENVSFESAIYSIETETCFVMWFKADTASLVRRAGIH
jgi:hypothetical protein